jgi:ElaB/YqjD/DUF883 family membrane-anchored ribosome-binding protein
MNEELEQILDEGRELIEELDLDERFEELKTEAELLIRKHPIQSVLIGAATGFILAKLFRR